MLYFGFLNIHIMHAIRLYLFVICVVGTVTPVRIRLARTLLRVVGVVWTGLIGRLPSLYRRLSLWRDRRLDRASRTAQTSFTGSSSASQARTRHIRWARLWSIFDVFVIYRLLLSIYVLLFICVGLESI